MKNENKQSKNELKASNSKTYRLKTEERTKNGRRTAKNLHGITYGNVSEALQKHLGSDFLPFFTSFHKKQLKYTA
ncbi:hypothetical protein GmHk_16G046209 [Glycine max]|nr:hypothetical protein GmHk_16G046209 [Glycine max]